MQLEPLEPRLMLDAGLPPSIVVGRTLSAYTTADVQNGQLEITYTVYNEQANPVTGVLLTDTLRSGVSFVTASQLPDRNGQELAWSLGTIQAFDRASITLTVSLDNSMPLQVDTGARAFGTLLGGMVVDGAPAAVLRTESVDPSLLASTPDADTRDPYIQEAAAALDYNPQNIFDFLQLAIGYNSYLGSLRGARGTLWSAAGNSLDEASLGVALFRASGIPARYAHGTLPDGLAQQLVLSMFPASYRRAGLVPDGAEVSDPANDPQLLAEARDHYWAQVEINGAFLDADASGLPGAGFGASLIPATTTFAETPDSLRAKARVTLTVEQFTQAAAALGVGGLGTSTVFDRTFDAAELVGRPLTIGHIVNAKNLPTPIFSSRTITYAPYVDIKDDAFPEAGALETYRGTDYQDVFTNFPLGNQVVTGLFLNVTLSGPGVVDETHSRTLLDRVGYAIRQNGGSPNISPNDPPLTNTLQMWTVAVQAAQQNPFTSSRLQPAIEAASNAATAQVDQGNTSVAAPYLVRMLSAQTTSHVESFLIGSDGLTAALADHGLVRAYAERPRIIIASVEVQQTSPDTTVTAFGLDLLSNSVRVIGYPGQSVEGERTFRAIRGIHENVLEAINLAPPVPRAGFGFMGQIDTFSVLSAAHDQGIPIVTLTPADAGLLDTLDLSAEAKARITVTLQNGLTVTVPASMVSIAGRMTVAWWQQDPQTGEITGVAEDGTHPTLALLTASLSFAVLGGVTLFASGSYMAGYMEFTKEVSFSAWLFADLEQHKLTKHEFEDPVSAKDLKRRFIAFLAFRANLYADNHSQGLLFDEGVYAAYRDFVRALGDPPLPPLLLNVPPRDIPFSSAKQELAVASTATAGAATGTVKTSLVKAVGDLRASWTSAAVNTFQVRSLEATGATVRNADGDVIGTGTVGLAGADLIPVTVGGSNTYVVAGQGSVTFYGPASGRLGVGGGWDDYTATANGAVALTLTTNDLTLNGQPLPAGVYTVTAGSISLTGGGTSSSPAFAESASVELTDGQLQLGPASEEIVLGGGPLDLTHGGTLGGYSGAVTVSADESAVDTSTLSGSATHVLTVSSSTTSLTADQNSPAVFAVQLHTSLADTYSVSVLAPDRWTVTLAADGTATARPPAGTQSGTYTLLLVAQSKSDPSLIAQATVPIAVLPTAPGVELAVTLDTVYTVPVHGAHSPTAFRADVRNLGPAADTYTMTVSDLPKGFEVLTNSPNLTVPGGETGVAGIYLRPNGAALPAPGAQVLFTVTATSVSNPAITATRTVNFTMPEVHGLSFTASPTGAGTTPGAPVNATLTMKAVGNVAETVNLSSELTNGLSISGLPASVSLQAGQSMDVPITLTPDVTSPLNSTVAATITAKFNPLDEVYDQSVQIPIHIVLPGAVAIANASDSATRLGNDDLANRLSDLAIALTNWVQAPDNEIFKSQALAALDALIPLVAAEQYLGSVVPELTADRGQLASATSAPEIGNAVTALAVDMTTLNNLLTQVIAHRFDLYVDTNTFVTQLNRPALFSIGITNQGTQTTTYDLVVNCQPNSQCSNITPSLTPRSVTLQPGETRFGGPNSITLSLNPTSPSLLSGAFIITATAHDSPAIKQTTTVVLTTRTEFVKIASVSADPPFANPGDLVNIAALVLNAINTPQSVLATFAVKDPNGTVVFTSNPIAATLQVQTAVTNLSLGSLDTTGFSPGDYSLEVSLTDSAGTLLPGGTAQGVLLIGTPVSGSMIANPMTTTPGNSIITNTLTLNSQMSFPSPLSLLGHATASQPLITASLLGNLAYVTTSDEVQIFDVSDRSNPSFVKAFGADVVTAGGFTYAQIVNGRLVVGSHIKTNSPDQDLLIYDLTDPLNPVLLSNTSIAYPYSFDMFAQGNILFLPLSSITFSNFNRAIVAQNGDLVAVDISDPSAPQIADVLFNTRGAPVGSNHNVDAFVGVTSQLGYAATSTSTGENTSVGVGQVLVINTSDPTNLSVIKSIDIPATIHAVGIGVQGNRALVVGTTGGWNNPTSTSVYGYSGNIILSVLDITDPANPILISSLVTDNEAGVGPDYSDIDVLDLGNGLFAVGDTTLDGQAVIQLVDLSDPNNLLVGSVPAPAVVTSLEMSASQLIAASSAGLSIYEIGTLTGVPVTASVRVPKATSVFTLTNTFSEPPTQIIPGTTFDTLIWKRSFGLGTSQATYTWRSRVERLDPDTARQVTVGTTLDFVSQGTPASIELPPSVVSAERVITLTPPSQAVAPGDTAEYTVNLINPTNSAVTFNLTVQGLATTWVSVTRNIIVPAHEVANIPLRLTPDIFALEADYSFTVTTTAPLSTVASAEGILTVDGEPALPEPTAHGVVVQVSPSQANVGQGTSTHFTVRVTNTGSRTESFDLSLAGLPPGVAAAFARTTVTVPPGIDNFREVDVTITSPQGTSPGDHPFEVTASTKTQDGSSDVGTANLTILANGVSLTVNPPIGDPGTEFQVNVVNTGEVADTFKLSLAGPAALVAAIAVSEVTLLPGASQTVTISTTAVDFAIEGNLSFIVVATSNSQPAVLDTVSVDLRIAPSHGLTAEFAPNLLSVSVPGTANFLLVMDNIGNMEDSFIATIASTTGPVNASLVNLDLGPAATVPLIRLPGLFRGAIVLNANLEDYGEGMVTVHVQSLTDPTIESTVVARVVPRGCGTGDVADGSIDFPWNNRLNPFDVNRDGRITPVGDVLPGINALNGAGLLDPTKRLPVPLDRPASFCYDVNRDNALTPVADILPIINLLNRGGQPEGETRIVRQDTASAPTTQSPMAFLSWQRPLLASEPEDQLQRYRHVAQVFSNQIDRDTWSVRARFLETSDDFPASRNDLPDDAELEELFELLVDDVAVNGK